MCGVYILCYMWLCVCVCVCVWMLFYIMVWQGPYALHHYVRFLRGQQGSNVVGINRGVCMVVAENLLFQGVPLALPNYCLPLGNGRRYLSHKDILLKRKK